MRRLRATWSTRITACVLLVSMGPLLLSAPAGLARRVVASGDAQWVRAQARGPVSEAFEHALADAASSGARSQRAFLAAFVSAFRAQQTGESLAGYFTSQALSDEALVALLADRLLLDVASAMASRACLTTAGGRSASLLGRIGFAVLPAFGSFAGLGAGAAGLMFQEGASWARPAGLLSAVFPHGP